jgi:predicted Zn-dependent protease
MVIILKTEKQKNLIKETILVGNLSGWLNNIVAISKEYLNNGFEQLPWLKVAGISKPPTT